MPFASVDQISSSAVWVWVNTYRYIFSGMNIHLPAILMFTRGTRFWHTAVCRKCRLILTTFGSQGVERIQMPPSVYFSQALFSRRSKNIVIHSKTQDFGWAHTQKKVLNDLPLQSQMEYWIEYIAWAKDVVRDKFCKFREGRSDVHWKAFDTLFVPIFGPEPKPTKLEVFPRFPP